MNTQQAPSCTIGLDLGGQSFKLGVVDAQGRISLRRQAAIDHSQPAHQLTQLLCGELNGLLQEAGRQQLQPRAIGMVMPGYMNRDRTQLVFAANMPTLSGGDFLQRVREALPLPVVFDADSNSAAFAEHKFGAGQSAKRLIVAVVGTGMGAGVIVDGRVLRVWHHIAGSLGHVIVDPLGATCTCRARGCVETRVSARAIEQHAEKLACEHPASRLAQLRAQHGRLSGAEVNEALAEGDACAAEVVDTCGWWLGVGVASWSVIYRPEKVVIGGGIAGFGEPLLAGIRRGLAEVGQPNATKDLTVELASLGPDAGLIGAAALAAEAVNDPEPLRA